MAKRERGEGSIYFNKQRKNWTAQHYEYNVNTGQMARKTKTFKTEKEAKDYLSTIMYQKQNPVYIEHNGIPLCEILKQNLNLKFETNQISAGQYARVSDTIRDIQKFPVGNKNIDKITSEEIQAYLNSLKHLSNSSIQKAYIQFRQAFQIAINKGYISRNPMIDVIKPKSDKENKVLRALTVEEQEKFTDLLLTRTVKEIKFKNVYLMQMYMGLRVGEALALTTHDIDLKNKKINVHRTLTTDENYNVIMGNKTKTYSGKRALPIPDFLYPYIVEQMQIADIQKNNEEKLLFKPDNNKYTRRSNVNGQLKTILKNEFGIIDITTHNLRHTFGTRCIESRDGTSCRAKAYGA